MEDLHKAKVSEEGRIISGLYGHFFFFFVIIFASSRLTWGVSRHEEGVVISSTIRFYSFLWKSVIKNHLCELFYCILVNPSFLFSIKHQSYSNSINIPQRYPLSFIHASYLNPPRTPRFGKQQLLSPQETKKRRNGHPLCPVRWHRPSGCAAAEESVGIGIEERTDWHGGRGGGREGGRGRGKGSGLEARFSFSSLVLRRFGASVSCGNY